MITTDVHLRLKGDAPGYDVEVTARAIIVRGTVPVDDFKALTALAGSKGFDLLDAGLASALDATFVMTNAEDSKVLRAEVASRLIGLGPIDEWLRGTDTGISSRTIVATLAAHPAAADLCGKGYPYDPDDFGRCYRLLKKIPEWRPRIFEMAPVSRQWEALVSHWAELEALYEEESPSGACPKLYARMKELTA
ncbi:MAG: hypothetical protein IMZ54_12320 [Acidobacteria bacterium]|nr:hypothetical protein [Spirochaetota bacterium]MBE3131483.1 hypothetical protein [Acidobacteriota bacterium]